MHKREKENEIKSELNNKLIMKQTNNRKIIIEKLQDKFMFEERTIMPKGTRLVTDDYNTN